MRNFNIFISVVIALIVVVGIFWLGNGGFPSPQEGIINDDILELEETTSVQEEVLIGIHPTFGEYLVDKTGLTLYTTSRECTGECLTIWPPYLGDENRTSGYLGTVRNNDLDSLQYTWKGEALYYYQEDLVPGDLKGDGVGGVWDVARP